jgi:hypothetical protein
MLRTCFVQIQQEKKNYKKRIYKKYTYMCYKILIPKHGSCSVQNFGEITLHCILLCDYTTLRHYNKNGIAKAITQNNFTPHREGQIQFQ